MGTVNQIVVLVPVFRRPHRVSQLAESFQQSDANARLLFIASPEDKQERSALDGHDHLVMPHARRGGDWARKINFGYRQTVEKWLLCAADDVRFHPGWDRKLLKAAATTDKRILGTNDLNPHADPNGIYSPHPLIARSYADELGTIDGPGEVFCEEYDHNFPDRELAETAISRNEWLFVRDAVVEHLHPGLARAGDDHTYRLGRRNANRDGRLFEMRRRRWLERQA